MHEHRHVHAVRQMYRVLEVWSSGFYAWVARPESARARRHRALTECIRCIPHGSCETYGAPRVHAELVAAGERVGKNTVARLMRKAGLVPKQVRKFRVTTASRIAQAVAPNRLDREFAAQRPNGRWVSDMTCIPTRGGWLYLAVILDLY